MPELTPEQLECLTSPRRSEVLAAIRSLGAGSASDVAQLVVSSREAAHYHLKMLAKVGLVEQSGQRAGVKKPESLYRALHERLWLPRASTTTEKAVLAGIRACTRGYQRAAQAARESARVAESIHIIRATLCLSPEDAETFRGMIEAASRFAIDRKVTEGTRLYWLSLVFPEA